MKIICRHANYKDNINDLKLKQIFATLIFLLLYFFPSIMRFDRVQPRPALNCGMHLPVSCSHGRLGTVACTCLWVAATAGSELLHAPACELQPRPARNCCLRLPVSCSHCQLWTVACACMWVAGTTGVGMEHCALPFIYNKNEFYTVMFIH